MPLDRVTLEQRLFIYDNFVRTENTKKVRHKFKKEYPNVDLPSKTAILKLVKRFRKTGSIADSVEKKSSKKSDKSRKTSDVKKKIPRTSKINISRETDISGILKTSGRRVTRLLKQRGTSKDVNEVQELLPDDQEPTFETVRIDSNEVVATMYIPEDCSAAVKSEPLIEYVEDEVCSESKICKLIKLDPASEDIKMEEVCTAKVNGNTIKTEPHLDGKPPVANELKSENSFSEKPKLLEDQIKQELVEDDETINEI